MTKKPLILLSIFTLAAAVGFGLAPKASAHRDGCHRWHSCPSDTGSYICGDTGHYSECPGAAATAPATPAPAPHVPVVTKQVLSSEAPIPYKSTVRNTDKEYPSYETLQQAGQNGLQRTNVEVTYTDGAETSRAAPSNEVITPAIDQVTIKGSRIIPSAKITRLHQTKKKDKYDVIGTYKPNSVVVLAVDGKRIKRAKSNTKGEFMFKQIKLTKASYALEIFNRVGNTETKVSEKYFVKPQKHILITEYDQDHGKKPTTF